MKLYEYDEEIKKLITEDGEVADIEAFNALRGERDEKIEALALWIKDLSAEADALAKECMSLSERKRATENKRDSLKRYLAFVLGGEKFKTARCAVSYRRSEAVTVENADELIAWCEENDADNLLSYKAPEISKAKIADALKAGAEIPFVKIEEKQNLIIK